MSKGVESLESLKNMCIIASLKGENSMTKIKIKDSFSRDAVVKDVFTSTKSGLEALSWIICDILRFSHDDFKFDVLHTNIGTNENVTNSEADIVVGNDNVIVNVEINTSKGRHYERKNNSYICQLVLRQTRKSSDYKNKYKKVYQININTYAVTDDDRTIIRSRILDDERHLEIHPFFEIYDINLAKLREMDYNIIRKNRRSWQYLLYILGCDSSSDLEKMYEGDELMSDVVKNIKAKVDDFDKLLLYNREVLNDSDPFQDTLEDGIRMGIEQGIEQNTIETAKRMILEECDTDLICNITKLSAEKVQKLREEL